MRNRHGSWCLICCPKEKLDDFKRRRTEMDPEQAKEVREVMLTEREMFEKSFERPNDYFELSEREQWEIDTKLGILDWIGAGLSTQDIERFKKHYAPAE